MGVYLWLCGVTCSSTLVYDCTVVAFSLQLYCTRFAVQLHGLCSNAAKPVQQYCKACAAELQGRCNGRCSCCALVHRRLHGVACLRGGLPRGRQREGGGRAGLSSRALQVFPFLHFVVGEGFPHTCPGSAGRGSGLPAGRSWCRCRRGSSRFAGAGSPWPGRWTRWLSALA